MSFFQNPFYEEFRGNWVLGDRHHSPSFVVKGNTGRDLDTLWNWTPPTLSGTAYIYDLDGNDDNGGDLSVLTFRLANSPDRSKGNVYFNTFTVDVAGATPAATTPAEIVTALNDDSMFSTFFTASLGTFNSSPKTFPAQQPQQIIIRINKPQQAKFFVENTGAEQELGFNARAGVAEAPTYFRRHTVADAYLHSDSVGSLVALSSPITVAATGNLVTSVAHGLTTGDLIRIEGSNSTPTVDGDRTVTVVDADTFTVGVVVTVDGDRGQWAYKISESIISSSVDQRLVSQNFALADFQYDWELLEGRSGIFNFKNSVVDSSSRLLESVEYSAGASAGDLAKKTIYTYTGAQTTPDTTVEIPYTLQASDLITP